MRTQVFAHKTIIGISSDIGAEGLINNPLNPGELGFVVDAAYVDIQPEALELLKQIRKSNGSLGDIDTFKADDDMVVFSWLGGPMSALDVNEVEGSRDFNPSLLSANVDIKPPKEFVDFVNTIE